MATKANLQLNLPLDWPKPSISLPEQTQVEIIASLADLILQVSETNESTSHSTEDKIDE
jgi:hypothetical protein